MFKQIKKTFFPVFPLLISREKHIFRLHLQYSLFEGIAGGLILSHAYVLKKGLLADATSLANLFQLVTVTLLGALVASELTRRSKSIKKLTLITGYISRLPLLLIAFLPPNIYSSLSIWIFVIAFGLFFLSVPFNGPILNLITKRLYRPHLFGALFATATVVRMAATFFFAVFMGIMLDIFPWFYQIAYPAAGILGLIGTISIATMPFSQKINSFTISRENLKFKFVPKIPIFHDFIKGVFRASKILLTDAKFRDYQIGMFLYGSAILSTGAFIQIIFDDELYLNYFSNNFYIAFQQLIMLFSLPLCGRFIGKIDPRKFSLYTYILFAIHLFLIILSPVFGTSFICCGLMICYPLLLAYFIGGIFLAAITVVWAIGSAYFCKPSDAADYQSTHVALTGIRGFIAPMLGIFIYTLSGSINLVLYVAIFTLFVAVAYCAYSLKKRPLHITHSNSLDEDIMDIATVARSDRAK